LKKDATRISLSVTKLSRNQRVVTTDYPHFERKLNQWGWLNSRCAGAEIIRDDKHSQFLAAMSANRFSQHASVFRRGFRRPDTFQFFAISRRFNALHASKI
jgi:hypothetical protein